MISCITPVMSAMSCYNGSEPFEDIFQGYILPQEDMPMDDMEFPDGCATTDEVGIPWDDHFPKGDLSYMNNDAFTTNWKNNKLSHWNDDDFRRWVIDHAQQFPTIDCAQLPLYLLKNFNEYNRESNLEKFFSELIADGYDSFVHELRMSYLILKDNDVDQEVPHLDRFDAESSFSLMSNYNYQACDQNGYLTYGSDSQEDVESDEGYNKTEVKEPAPKRAPGRPRGSGKKQVKGPKNVSVWQFLIDLLSKKDSNPDIIKWEDFESKKFRFVKPNEVARRWGMLRSNRNIMSFEKFSRAMRYHYKQDILESVPEARLVYKFGKKAPLERFVFELR